jgi:transcriptional regulator with XRE-family HTH domain
MTKEIALYKTFGANLKKYRNMRQLSQRALDALCGIDHGMISKMENGRINVTLNTIFILATSLGVSGWELLLTTDSNLVTSQSNSTLPI